MSLNRRLYAWLLGLDHTGQPLAVPNLESQHRRDSMSSELELGYFNAYGKDLLVHAVKNCIREGSVYTGASDGKPTNLRPFRILISLLDKPEIGSSILEDVLIEIFRCMYRECMQKLGDKPEHGITRHRAKKDTAKMSKEEKAISSEIVKTANLLFGVFEPYFIWDFLGRVFEKVCMLKSCDLRELPAGHDVGDLTVTELCHLVDFLLDKLTLVSNDTAQMIAIYLNFYH